MSKKGENNYKRKDGRWEARYEKARLPSGEIRYGYCYAKTYHDVKVKVGAAKAGVLKGKTLPSDKQTDTFASYCTEWLNVKSASVKRSTLIWRTQRKT